MHSSAHKIILRSLCLLLLAVSLSSCQLNPKGFDDTLDGLLKKGSEALNIMNTFVVIQRDFEHGRIMRARARVLAMDRDHKDYAKSQLFLKQKIEPARRRIFLHYLKAAKQRERQQRWAAAMWAYDQAKAVTIKPAKMEDKRLEMEWKMRQLRFDKLLQQRRREDVALLNDGRAYTAPKGVHANDEVYGRFRDFYNDALDDRAGLAYREAKRFLRLKLPEIAYIEIESYIRLQPATAQGKKMLAQIRRKMSKRLSILPVHSQAIKSVAVVKRIAVRKHVNKEQVIAAMKAGDWPEAQLLAQAYQRDDGQGADKLLARIQAKMDVQAAFLFTKGNKAFAQEKLDLAIGYWRGATVLKPEKSEYREALHRARQLKERLSLLREQKRNP
ncbi:MAG: 4-hydroxy-3-methylbut-2-en-1-yl diphosphate synthase [Mariprofundus sp.]|nr:4-hydroxy-3-methylbut-2-en-1-yl diphosphate synthase [Mariprofundus sp.]